MAAAVATGGEFAATWRTTEGEIVSSTFGGTMCWMPLRPWSLRIAREDFSAIIPCGECPGCLEFYRRRLAGRLAAKYRASSQRRNASTAPATGRASSAASVEPGQLYLIRIYAPLEKHAALSRKLHRRRGLELEPGFLRLGATSFVVLSRERAVAPLLLKRMGLACRVEAVHLKRGRRAWRGATAGMLVSREAYGAQLNRFYLPGLPSAEKESWDVHTQAGAKGYSRRSSPRSWKGNKLVLVPPEVWMLGRADRRTLRRDLGQASSPEGVARVMAMVNDLVARRSQSSLIGPAVRPVLQADQVREWYAARAKRKGDARASAPTSQSSSPPSEGGGYVSSVHTGDAGPPGPAAGDGLWHDVPEFRPRHIPELEEDRLTDLTNKQMLRRRERRKLDELLESIYQRAKGRT